jgi:hypothetical protein
VEHCDRSEDVKMSPSAPTDDEHVAILTGGKNTKHNHSVLWIILKRYRLTILCAAALKLVVVGLSMSSPILLK